MANKKRAGRASLGAVSLFLAIALIVFSLSVLPVSAANADTVTVAAKYQKGHLAAGDSFVVTVYPDDPAQMQAVRLSGLEYSFSYDPSLFSADVSSLNCSPGLLEVNGWNESLVSASVSNGSVHFASHLRLFDANTGYTSGLTEFFTLILTANSEIAEISDVFSVTPSVKAVASDGRMLSVSPKTVIFTNTFIFDLVPDGNGFSYLSDPTVGGNAYSLPAVVYSGGNRISCGAFLTEVTTDSSDLRLEVRNAGKAVAPSDAICTGYLLNLYEFGVLKQSCVIILKGDGNCDGSVDVYDAVDLLRYIVGDNPLEVVSRLALKNVGGASDAGIYDVVGILRFIVSSAW